jgi:hypothetical protein
MPIIHCKLKQNALCPHRSECLKQAAKSSTFRPDCQNCKFGNVKEDLLDPWATVESGMELSVNHAAARMAGGGISL